MFCLISSQMHPLLLPRLMLAAAVAFVVAAELSTPWADVDVDLTTTELVTRLKQVDAVQKQQLQRQQQLDGWEDTSKGSTPARQLLLEDQQQQQEQQQDRPTPLQQLDQQPLLERHHWAHHHASYRYLLTRRQRQRGISYYGSAERLRNALSRALKSAYVCTGTHMSAALIRCNGTAQHDCTCNADGVKLLPAWCSPPRRQEAHRGSRWRQHCCRYRRRGCATVGRSTADLPNGQLWQACRCQCDCQQWRSARHDQRLHGSMHQHARTARGRHCHCGVFCK